MEDTFRLRALTSLAALFLLCAPVLLARHGEPPPSRTKSSLPLGAVPVFELPAVDVESELAIDERDAKILGPAPLRYAVSVGVAVTPDTVGHWELLAGGDRLWRARFHAPGATDLNFGFTEYELPPGASLYVSSEAADHYEGPYTYLDNEDHAQLWTPPVPGARAFVELYVPAEVKFEPRLALTRVGTGYRDLFHAGHSLKQGACNNDVICPEGEAWRDQIRSVARYSLGGSMLCTGSMVMDVPGSFRPFFLTANHCELSAGNAPSMVVFWNFESPVCGQLSGGSLADNQTGATFRASRTDVDMALVELDDPPDPSFQVFWTGWDRSGTTPQGSVGIHHPGGDEKAISFNTDPLTTIDSCIGFGSNTHWEVDDWEDGTTEPGSSGSGLWDPATQKLVGFLSGGIASCSIIGLDCYGKFSVAWDRGTTASTRLKDWLDPNDQGDLMVDGSEPPPVVFYVSHQGSDSCAGGAQGNGLWEPGETLEVQVSIGATGDLTQVQGTLTSSTPGVTVVDRTATWPDLTAGVDMLSDAPHFTVQLALGLFCLTQIDFDLQVTASETGPLALVFSQEVGTSIQADVPKPIPDSGSATSTLVVGQNVTLSGVDVFVDIQHNYVGDLSLSLTSPAGTTVDLLDRPGVPASVFGCGDDDMRITFDDSAVMTDLETHCPGTTPWFEGSATPVDSLADLDGEPSAGTWTLTISDRAGVDTGSVTDWQLLAHPPLNGSCQVCEGGPIFVDGFESGDVSRWSTVLLPPVE